MVTFIYALSAHWVKPLKQDFPLYQQGYEYGINEADLIFSSYCLGILIIEQLAHGYPLAKIKDDIIRYQKMIPYNKQVQYTLLINKQYILNLEDKTKSGSHLDSDHFDETRMLQELKHEQASSAIVEFYLYRLQLAVLYDEQAVAIKMRQAAGKVIPYMIGHILMFEYHFFAALSYTKSMQAPFETNHEQARNDLKQHYSHLKIYAKIVLKISYKLNA